MFKKNKKSTLEEAIRNRDLDAIKSNLREIKESNIKKIDTEIKDTARDLSRNKISISEKNKNGEIKLNITTNRRTIILGAAIAVLKIAALSYFISKKNKK